MLVSLTMVVALSVSAFNSIRFSCIYLENLFLDTYTLPSLLPDSIDPFKVMESPFCFE